MTWTVAPEVPTRKVGASWTTDEAPPARAYGQGWFSPDFVEKVTPFSATGTLHTAVATSYPYSTAGLAGSGALTAIVRPKLAMAVAFTGLGGLVGPTGESKRITAAFSAEGSNDGVTINDGFWGIVVGGVTPQDGLSGIVIGLGGEDGLSGTVTAGMKFSAAGSFTATVTGGVPGTPMPVALSATGSLTATVVPRTLVSAGLSAAGLLAGTVDLVPAQFASADFASVGVFATTGFESYKSAAALSGDGALSGTVFKAIVEDNTNRTNFAIPAGATTCFVTLIGAGGAGGNAGSLTDGENWQYGGAGGSGGARINRFAIPVSSLTSGVYSVTRGTPVAGGNGNASTFSSSGKTLTAGGGIKGTNGNIGGNFAPDSAGGAWSQSGFTGVTGQNGGGGSGDSRSDGGSTSGAGAGAGGGAGGYNNTFGSGTNPQVGASGGSSPTKAGGTGGAIPGLAGGSPTAATATNGGAGGGGGGGGDTTRAPGNGGTGGNFGGGGGGQGAGYPGTLNTAAGGTGFTRIEFN